MEIDYMKVIYMSTGQQSAINNLLRIAASRKRRVLEVSDIRPIANRPQDAILPYNEIVAARPPLQKISFRPN
jgi:hypothetical protein